jgi:hypothetical protein
MAVPVEEKRLGGEMQSRLRKDSKGTSLICVIEARRGDPFAELVSTIGHIEPAARIALTEDESVVVALSPSDGSVRVFVIAGRFVDLTGREIRRYQEVSDLSQLGK